MAGPDPVSTGGSADASSWLASKGVRAVGADNVSWDEVEAVDPNLKVTLPGHMILLVRTGTRYNWKTRRRTCSNIRCGNHWRSATSRPARGPT